MSVSSSKFGQKYIRRELGDHPISLSLLGLPTLFSIPFSGFTFLIYQVKNAVSFLMHVPTLSVYMIHSIPKQEIAKGNILETHNGK